MKRETVLITGASGQDGRLLAQALSSRYDLVLTSTSSGTNSNPAVRDAMSVVWENLDIRDTEYAVGLIEKYTPQIVFNLAGKSSVHRSLTNDPAFYETNSVAVENLLNALHNRNVLSSLRFYQASSSEMFGSVREGVADETTPMNPTNPYGKSKHHAHQVCNWFRQRFGYFIVSGILFNHESEYRNEDFLFGKITHSMARVFLGKQQKIELGNIRAQRDWGFAEDYVQSMIAMINNSNPEDFVVATGKLHSVEEVFRAAHKYLDIQVPIESILRVDQSLIRPTNDNGLIGDSSKIRNTLFWKPSIDFFKMVERIQAQVLNQYLK